MVWKGLLQGRVGRGCSDELVCARLRLNTERFVITTEMILEEECYTYTNSSEATPFSKHGLGKSMKSKFSLSYILRDIPQSHVDAFSPWW